MNQQSHKIYKLRQTLDRDNVRILCEEWSFYSMNAHCRSPLLLCLFGTDEDCILHLTESLKDMTISPKIDDIDETYSINYKKLEWNRIEQDSSSEETVSNLLKQLGKLLFMSPCCDNKELFYSLINSKPQHSVLNIILNPKACNDNFKSSFNKWLNLLKNIKRRDNNKLLLVSHIIRIQDWENLNVDEEELISFIKENPHFQKVPDAESILKIEWDSLQNGFYNSLSKVCFTDICDWVDIRLTEELAKLDGLNIDIQRLKKAIDEWHNKEPLPMLEAEEIIDSELHEYKLID